MEIFFVDMGTYLPLPVKSGMIIIRNYNDVNVIANYFYFSTHYFKTQSSPELASLCVYIAVKSFRVVAKRGDTHHDAYLSSY